MDGTTRRYHARAAEQSNHVKSDRSCRRGGRRRSTHPQRHSPGGGGPPEACDSQYFDALHLGAVVAPARQWAQVCVLTAARSECLVPLQSNSIKQEGRRSRTNFGFAEARLPAQQLPFSSDLTRYFVLQPVAWCFLEGAAGPKHVQTSVQGPAWTTRLGG